MSKESEEVYESGQEFAVKRKKPSIALSILADGIESELV